jgi:mono/diheme cytochrome c family protein
MDAAKMARIIRNGKGDMPGNKKLSAAQIAGLVRYVKTL